MKASPRSMLSKHSKFNRVADAAFRVQQANMERRKAIAKFMAVAYPTKYTGPLEKVESK